MADTIVPYGVPTLTRKNTFTRPGYTFEGWNVYNSSNNTWRYYNPKNGTDTGWYTVGKQPIGWVKMVYPNGVDVAQTGQPGEIVIFYAVWNRTYK